MTAWNPDRWQLDCPSGQDIGNGDLTDFDAVDYDRDALAISVIDA